MDPTYLFGVLYFFHKREEIKFSGFILLRTICEPFMINLKAETDIKHLLNSLEELSLTYFFRCIGGTFPLKHNSLGKLEEKFRGQIVIKGLRWKNI